MSCPECQLVNPGAILRPLLRSLPLMEVPIDRIGMDLIRPFHQRIMQHNTWKRCLYVAFGSVVQALFQVISRPGIPKEILTDQGTLFMSCTFIKSIWTSVYHTQADWLVERLNKKQKTQTSQLPWALLKKAGRMVQAPV